MDNFVALSIWKYGFPCVLLNIGFEKPCWDETKHNAYDVHRNLEFIGYNAYLYVDLSALYEKYTALCSYKLCIVY